MAAGETVSIASASNTVYSTYTPLTGANFGSGLRDAQNAALFVVATAGSAPSGSGTIRLVLISDGAVIGYKDFTYTPGSVRSGLDGSSGGYFCTLTDTASSQATTNVDLNGARTGSAYWAVGCPDAFATNVTALSLQFCYNQAV